MINFLYADFETGVQGRFYPANLPRVLNELQRPYSADPTGRRHNWLLEAQVCSLLEMSEGEFPNNSTVVLSPKAETFNGCHDSIDWRARLNTGMDIESGRSFFAITKGVTPDYELKTIVMPAFIARPGLKATDLHQVYEGELVLVAFHSRADKNLKHHIYDIEHAVNKDLANYVSRKGHHLYLQSSSSFEMFTNGKSVSQILGGALKGELNPHSLLHLAHTAGVRLVQYFSKEVDTDQPIATNFSKRCASITYGSGKTLIQLCEFDAPELYVPGKPVLPQIRVVPDRALFFKPLRERPDNGWDLHTVSQENMIIR